ncbi:MAG: glycosyltransferase [Candidatus Atabeyarchaeum deiterrae]
MAGPELSIIIPTFNERENIGTCLRALNHQTTLRVNYEIIVVDGGSNDGTRELAKNYGADRIIIQKGEGVAGAKNDAAAIAKGKIVATMDADVIAPKTWVATILERFRDRRVIGLAGVSHSIERDSMSRVSLDLLAVWARVCAFAGRPLLSGQGSAISLDVFRRIGGYKPEFSMIHDVEIGMRAREYGKIVFDKNWVVYTSARRIQKIGIRKYYSLMGKAVLSFLLKRKVPGAKYTREDYTRTQNDK